MRTVSRAELDLSQDGQRCCGWGCEHRSRDGSRKWPELEPLLSRCCSFYRRGIIIAVGISVQ